MGVRTLFEGLGHVLHLNKKEHPGHKQLEHWQEEGVLPAANELPEGKRGGDTMEEPPTIEGEQEKELEPIPEGSGIVAIDAADGRPKWSKDLASPEFLFRQMKDLTPFQILPCLRDEGNFDDEDSLPGASHQETRAPKVFTFRDVSYRLKIIREGAMGTVYMGEARSEHLRQYPDRPRRIVFKAIKRGVTKDLHTVREIAALATMNPDPLAPADSIVRHIHWAGRTQQEAEAFRKKAKEFAAEWKGQHGNYTVPLEREEGFEAFPTCYDAFTYRVGEWKGIGIIMEYVEGETYAEATETSRAVIRDKKGSMPLRERAAGLFELAQVAGALATMHARGIEHRDVKPGNLMMGNDGKMRILDLGLGMDPYFRGREELYTEVGAGYDKALEYAFRLYEELIDPYGVGFDQDRKRDDRLLTEEEELELWEAVKLVTEMVYTSEISDAEWVEKIQKAFLLAEMTYQKYARIFKLPKVESLGTELRRKILVYKLHPRYVAVPERPAGSDVVTEKLAMRRFVEDLDPNRTSEGGITVGTPVFMAPEQVMAQDVPLQLRGRSDVFSLGTTLLGRLQFGTMKKAKDIKERLELRGAGKDIMLPDDEALSPLEKELKRFLEKVFTFSPEARLTAAEMRNELYRLGFLFQSEADGERQIEIAQMRAKRVAG